MVFNFDSYRSYLKHYLKQLPKSGFGEARRIAQYLGVSSTYISQVFAGDKEFSFEQAEGLTKYLGLSELEAEYFFYLVHAERAGTTELKKFCKEKLAKIKTKSLDLSHRLEAKKSMTSEEKSVFYSNSLYSSAHIYCSTGKKGRTLDEIAKRFSITRAKANEVMQFLVQSGMSQEKDHHFSTTTQSTHLERGSAHLLKHHTNWRLRALQAAENLQVDELMYTVNVALSEKDFVLLREETVSFIKNFLERVHPSPSEEIACLNIDWFRIRS